MSARKRRVWIAQLLCGPNRHCIAALAREATSQAEAEQLVGAAVLWPQVNRLGINPWCAICGARRDDSWHIELRRTRWPTMAEAEAPILASATKQAITNIVLGTHGPKPPTRQ